MKILKGRTFKYIFLLIVISTLISMLVADESLGQSNTSHYTPAALERGIPQGSNLSDIEHINLYNGDLKYNIPLLQVGGRGSSGYTMRLPIEHRWQVFVYDHHPGQLFYNAQYEWWDTTTAGYGAGLVLGRQTTSECQSFPSPPVETDTNITFTTPDGTEVELRDVVANGEPLLSYCGGEHGASRGTIFKSTDGSHMTFISDTTVYDRTYQSIFPLSPSGYLMFKDGTKYRIDTGRVSWIRDRNGNLTTFSYANFGQLMTVTDSLGHQITVEHGITEPAPYGLCDKITFKGSSGAERIIRVSKGTLHDALRPGEVSSAQMFPNMHPTWTMGGFNTDGIISSVWLPDGRSYQFLYNAYGDIAKVTLPTDASIEYDWWGSDAGNTIYRRVIERRVYPDGFTLEGKTTYDVPDAHNPAPIIVRDRSANGTQLSVQKHYFYGNAWSESAPLYPPAPAPRPSWLSGREYRTEYFGSDGTTLLQAVTQTWYQDPPTWQVPPYSDYILNNPRIIETTQTITDTNQISKKTFSYDGFNNLTDTYEYDFGAGQPGAFRRRSHTDYVTDTNYTSHTGAHLRSLPLQTWVSSDINGNTKASLTQFEYDNYNTDAGHAALVSRSNVVGHDTTNYGTNNIRRGNVTAVTSYANAQAQTGAVTVYSQYDILGNVVKAIDAKGCASTSNYDDNFGAPDGEAQTNTPPSQLNGLNTFAFPKSATNCMGWITGYSQVDYFTGASVNTEDINGVISKTIYNDPLDRPTQSISAIGTDHERQSNIVYDDANRRIETKSDLFTLNDNLIKSESFYDGLGRTFESRSYKDGGYVVSKSEFDALGRVKRVTNPYRPHLSEQELWTESFYDALGRVIKIKTPDNAEALTSYSGNAVTVTDQAGKERRSVTNALGQLIRVDEPNAAGQLGTVASPNQPTHYSYNTLGKMVKVNQGVQNRYFMYDSLGHMLRVRQPEQEVNTSLNTSGNPDNNSWSAGFTYDNNGNVLTATDAEDTTITNTYDALNRALTTTYSDGTPTVTNFYDGTGLPSVPANSKGKLTKVSSSISESKYVEFDVVGRLKQFQQYTDGQTYTSKYTYNLSGALVEEEYPSGRKVRNDFDSDGDIARIHGIANPTVTEKTYATSFSYFADGRIEKLKLGNGLWESAKVNARLQVTELAVGYSVGNGGLMKLNYEYGELQTNGTVDALKNSGHIAKQSLSFDGLANPFVQSFTYDSLYRLKEAKETSNSNQTWKQVFDYDRYGNRTAHEKYIGTTQIPLDNTTHPAIDPNTNRFPSNEGYTFDKNGNIIIDAFGRQFTFNGDNKQTQVRDDQNNVIGQYFYDGEGKRIKKVTNSETTVFVYSGGKLIAEYSTATPPQDPTTSYTITDQLGSPRVIVDALGQVISRRDFLPFGEEVEIDGTYRTTNQKYGQADSVRQRFTGYQKDEETQLDFAEARMYENRHGRFTAVDPLLASGKSANPQTFNRYVYVMNNPLAYTDPTGLQAGTGGDDISPCRRNSNCNVSVDTRTNTASGSGFALIDLVVDVATDTYQNVETALTGYFQSTMAAISSSDPLQNLNYQRFEAVQAGDSEALNQRLFGFLGPSNFDTLQATTDSFRAAETIANANLGFQSFFAAGTSGYLSGYRFSQGISSGSTSVGGERSAFPSIKPGSSGGPTAGSRYISVDVRRQAAAENPYNFCVYCRQQSSSIQFEHATPLSRGGNSTIENIQRACPFCNQSKGARDFPVNPAPGYEGPFPPPWWNQ